VVFVRNDGGLFVPRNMSNEVAPFPGVHPREGFFTNIVSPFSGEGLVAIPGGENHSKVVSANEDSPNSFPIV
ncbi:MAG: hypothetical protein P8X47_05405, partial [Ignavibacteriaceae bacterium]